MAEDIERVNYYQLEYLGAEDFKAEQAYHRDMRRRHNVGHHLLGIVTGLEITEVKKGSGAGFDTYVQPGLAIDGFGREIIVTTPYKLDPADFRSFSGIGTHEVWIAYREQLDTPPGAGFDLCEGEDQNKRVHEDFRIVIDPPSPKHPPVVVGGKAAVLKSDPAAANAPAVIPDDESVPYQDFPDEAERWLVRLGTATWNANAGVFEQTAAPLPRDAGRVYTGIVAESVLSPAARLVLRPRMFVAGDEDKDDFAKVQGRLQVDGRIVAKKDVFLHGGRLSLQTANGSDDNVPFWIRRMPPVSPAGYDLRVDIGPKDGKQRLSIGTDSDDPAKAKTLLAVRADDNVDIATGKLNFGTAPLRQMLNLNAEDYGIGVQTATLYHRSLGGYAWYRGGKHDDTPATSGAGGTMAMQLDAANKLKVFGAIEGTSLRAPTVQTNEVFVDGGKVHLRLPGGAIDSDEISIARFQQATNSNDLRVIIGDDLLGVDAFTIGPIPGGTYLTQFRVANTGDVSMKGQLTLDAGKFVNIGTMRLGGKYPVDVIVARHFINKTNATGVFPPTSSPPITVTSRMPVVSTANVVLALAQISNAGPALNAGWRVFPTAVSTSGNQVSYRVSYSVTDSDGYLGMITAIIVMVP